MDFLEGSGDSFTDLLWDQLDFGDAIASASTLMFDSWLTGIDVDAWLSSTTSQLIDLYDSANITSDMGTSEIVDAIEDTDFQSSELGWVENIDLQTMLDNLHTLAMYMEVLSFTQGLDISAFHSLGELESVLSDFGYPGLYSMTDIYEFLDKEVASDIPDSFQDYQSQLEVIEQELAAIISDEDGAPYIGDVLSDMEVLIDELQSEVDNGDTSLSDAVDNLTIAYIALGMYTEDPAEILLSISEDLLALFDETNFDYNDLDSELGKNWLSSFVGAMQEISESDNNEYQVCPDNYIRDIMSDQYSYLQMGWNCHMLILNMGNSPDCDCLNNAGIYEDDDKQDILSSMNCLFTDGDDLTVEQQLRVCNGEVIEVNEKSEVLDALERFESLTDLLTGENYGSSLILYVTTAQLSNEFQEIIDDIIDLSSIQMISDGTEGEYLDYVSNYIDSFNNLLSDMDFDGSYSEQRRQLSDLLEQALGQVIEDDSNDAEPAKSGGSGGSIGKLLWIALVLCVLMLGFAGFGLCCCYVKRRNTRFEEIALEAGIEGNVGIINPEFNGKNIDTAVTSGEGEK